MRRGSRRRSPARTAAATAATLFALLSLFDQSIEKGNGEAMIVTDLDPAKLAERRRSVYFIPRCLRPEMYLGIRPEGDA